VPDADATSYLYREKETGLYRGEAGLGEDLEEAREWATASLWTALAPPPSQRCHF
jgi:hypothetical protein